MTDRQLRFTQAQLRMELRDLEVEIQRLRHEQQFYRRMRFDCDLQDMQMVELVERRRGCESQLRQLQTRSGRRGDAKVGWLSWLILSPYLLVVAVQSALLRRQESAS